MARWLLAACLWAGCCACGVAAAGLETGTEVAASVEAEIAAAESGTPDTAPDSGRVAGQDVAGGATVDPFAAAVAALNAKSYSAKGRAAEELATLDHPRVITILQALLAGDLYYRNDDGRIVIARKSEQGYWLADAVDGTDLGEVGSRDAKKITVNNALRSRLKASIARLNLGSPDSALRLAAVREMTGALDEAGAARLRAVKDAESETAVREAIRLAIASYDLKSADAKLRLAAVEELAGEVIPEVRNRLAGLARDDSDPEVRAAASEALEQIEFKLQLYALSETIFFGLSLGSVLLLAAIGLAITFGVMGVINMAHGELIMLGAYTTYLVQSAMPGYADFSVLVAIPAAFIVAGLFGIAIERGVIRFLYGRPLETLLATFGISLVLQQLVRTTVSAQNVAVSNPSWMSGSLQLNPALSITYNRAYILVFALAVFVALLLIIKKTSLGLKVRAVSQNRAMARAMGVRSDWVDAMTFGLGSGIAGVAGVALSQLTNVGPNMGQSYIIDSFMVVVFGGVGNLWGTFVGAMSLGVVNKFLEPYSGAVLAKILVLVFIIVFIQKRPRGLFPQKGRAAEN